MLSVFFSVIVHAIMLSENRQLACTIVEKRQIAWVIMEKKTDSMCYHGKKGR